MFEDVYATSFHIAISESISRVVELHKQTKKSSSMTVVQCIHVGHMLSFLIFSGENVAIQ